MQTQSISQSKQPSNFLTRLVLGLLVLTLTLLLIVTAVDSAFDSLFIDESCETTVADSFETFSAETAVPNCWLVQ